MEKNNQFNGVLEGLFQGMNSAICAKTVVGEATKVGDTIILPLVDVSFGMGAGCTKAGDNAGGGIGGKMSPSAVLVIQNGQTKLINIKNQDAVTKILDMVPDLVDKFTSKKNDEISDEEAKNIAFPEEN